ncbi:ribonuclease PH [Armatimonadetes bacterium Uphvl-Ar1]|nr:ribonuclease PH [Armatimonadetes bacterium Uphvl-Ar1]
MRSDGRANDQLRPIILEAGFSKHAEGSCLIKMGDTHMHVTATVEDNIPRWLKGKGSGWVTAEYSMLPRSGKQRNQRDAMRGGPNGRTMEIQRLIGRALRSVIDLERMGERTITIDCDALMADGGTRTASITAAYVATYQAFEWMKANRMIKQNLMREPMAAISVGVVRGQELLDLNYEEDSTAQTDMNIVMTASGKFIEIQGTAESDPFGPDTLGRMLALGKKGILELIELQKEALSN